MTTKRKTVKTTDTDRLFIICQELESEILKLKEINQLVGARVLSIEDKIYLGDNCINARLNKLEQWDKTLDEFVTNHETRMQRLENDSVREEINKDADTLPAQTQIIMQAIHDLNRIQELLKDILNQSSILNTRGKITQLKNYVTDCLDTFEGLQDGTINPTDLIA